MPEYVCFPFSSLFDQTAACSTPAGLHELPQSRFSWTQHVHVMWPLIVHKYLHVTPAVVQWQLPVWKSLCSAVRKSIRHMRGESVTTLKWNWMHKIMNVTVDTHWCTLWAQTVKGECRRSVEWWRGDSHDVCEYILTVRNWNPDLLKHWANPNWV